MQKLYTAVTLLLFGCLAHFKASAQAGVPMSLRPDYNRMMGNMNMNMTMNQMMSQRWYYGMPGLANYKYDFKVTMKDGTVKVVTSKIYADTTTHKSYLIFVNKDLKRSDPNRETRVYPSETVKISREQVDFEKKFDVEGVPTDSCWLFKVMKGKINAYSHLSEVVDLNEAYLRAFQTGDGPIQKLDSAALAPLVKEDPKAFKAFEKKNYYKAIDKYNSDHQ